MAVVRVWNQNSTILARITTENDHGYVVTTLSGGDEIVEWLRRWLTGAIEGEHATKR